MSLRRIKAQETSQDPRTWYLYEANRGRSMRTSVANEGDVICIPIEREKWAVAKVLFVSTRYKDVMLLGVFDQLVDNPKLGSVCNDSEYCLRIYSGRRGFHRRGWRICGDLPVSEEDFEMSRRIIAGMVWIGDELVGTASKDDEARLPQMDVAGHIRVELLIQRYFAAA